MKTSNSDKSPQESPWIPAKENNSEPDELEPHIETDTSGFTILSEYLVEVHCCLCDEVVTSGV